MTDSSCIARAHVQLPSVQEILGKPDSVGDILATEPPGPAVTRLDSIPGVITATRQEVIGAGSGDAVDSCGRGQSVDESLFRRF